MEGGNADDLKVLDTVDKQEKPSKLNCCCNFYNVWFLAQDIPVKLTRSRLR